MGSTISDQVCDLCASDCVVGTPDVYLFCVCGEAVVAIVDHGDDIMMHDTGEMG
jgi:hypothetical protein